MLLVWLLGSWIEFTIESLFPLTISWHWIGVRVLAGWYWCWDMDQFFIHELRICFKKSSSSCNFGATFSAFFIRKRFSPISFLFSWCINSSCHFFFISISSSTGRGSADTLSTRCGLLKFAMDFGFFFSGFISWLGFSVEFTVESLTIGSDWTAVFGFLLWFGFLTVLVVGGVFWVTIGSGSSEGGAPDWTSFGLLTWFVLADADAGLDLTSSWSLIWIGSESHSSSVCFGSITWSTSKQYILFGYNMIEEYSLLLADGYHGKPVAKQWDLLTLFTCKGASTVHYNNINTCSR